MINGSRRLRIANGSGVQVNDVNQLVDRFFEARKMMGQLGGMGLPGMRAQAAPRSRPRTTKGKKGKPAAAARRSRGCRPAYPGGVRPRRSGACRRSRCRPA